MSAENNAASPSRANATGENAHDNPYDATHRAYNITELLEHIILHLPPLDILAAKAVNKRFKSIIESSTKFSDKINFRDAIQSVEEYEKNKTVTLNPAIFRKPPRSNHTSTPGVLTALSWGHIKPSIKRSTSRRAGHSVVGQINLYHIKPNSTCRSMIVCDSPEKMLPIEICLQWSASGARLVALKRLRSENGVTMGMVLDATKEMHGRWDGEFRVRFPPGVEVVMECAGDDHQEDILGEDVLRGLFG